VQVDSTRLESWRNLAFVYYHLDSLGAAVDAYQRILIMAPGDTGTHYSLGVLHLKEKAHAQALQSFTAFLSLKPDDVDGLVNLGFAHMQLEQYAEAEAVYRRALALNPGMEQTHYNLGNLYWKQKNYPAAREAYQQALALAPGDDDARYNLAITWLALEQWDQALPLLEELAQRLPDSAGVWQGLGQVYAVQGRIEESKQAYAKADALAR
jgi:tetratricopeptide (TPR) repeat protein